MIGLSRPRTRLRPTTLYNSVDTSLLLTLCLSLTVFFSSRQPNIIHRKTKGMGSVLSSFFGGPAAAAEPSGPSRVNAFHSSERWKLHFNSSKHLNKLMVVDFSASWCGPCKFMEPVFNDLSNKYSDVDFVKIDVDELSDVAREFGVQAMPTFLLLKQGKEVERIMGAQKNELENKILKHREAPKFAA